MVWQQWLDGPADNTWFLRTAFNLNATTHDNWTLAIADPQNVYLRSEAPNFGVGVPYNG